jgi:hypothetical protein
VILGYYFLHSNKLPTTLGQSLSDARLTFGPIQFCPHRRRNVRNALNSSHPVLQKTSRREWNERAKQDAAGENNRASQNKPRSSLIWTKQATTAPWNAAQLNVSQPSIPLSTASSHLIITQRVPTYYNLCEGGAVSPSPTRNSKPETQNPKLKIMDLGILLEAVALVPHIQDCQGPRNVDLRTPPGPEGSNGSLLDICRGHPGIFSMQNEKLEIKKRGFRTISGFSFLFLILNF